MGTGETVRVISSCIFLRLCTRGGPIKSYLGAQARGLQLFVKSLFLAESSKLGFFDEISEQSPASKTVT
jgi:hypothetical protein